VISIIAEILWKSYTELGLPFGAPMRTSCNLYEDSWILPLNFQNIIANT